MAIVQEKQQNFLFEIEGYVSWKRYIKFSFNFLIFSSFISIRKIYFPTCHLYALKLHTLDITSTITFLHRI